MPDSLRKAKGNQAAGRGLSGSSSHFPLSTQVLPCTEPHCPLWAIQALALGPHPSLAYHVGLEESGPPSLISVAPSDVKPVGLPQMSRSQRGHLEINVPIFWIGHPGSENYKTCSQRLRVRSRNSSLSNFAAKMLAEARSPGAPTTSASLQRLGIEVGAPLWAPELQGPAHLPLLLHAEGDLKAIG